MMINATSLLSPQSAFMILYGKQVKFVTAKCNKFVSAALKKDKSSENNSKQSAKVTEHHTV